MFVALTDHLFGDFTEETSITGFLPNINLKPN